MSEIDYRAERLAHAYDLLASAASVTADRIRREPTMPGKAYDAMRMHLVRVQECTEILAAVQHADALEQVRLHSTGGVA